MSNKELKITLSDRRENDWHGAQKVVLTEKSIYNVVANDSFFLALSDYDKLRVAKLFSKKILAQALMEVDNAD